ncbi:MAG: hypothetical protein NZM26_03215 [Patescibacteria group bacterium]|nr:hypothetical protein [Patescibacteria group bacterium]
MNRERVITPEQAHQIPISFGLCTEVKNAAQVKIFDGLEKIVNQGMSRFVQDIFQVPSDVVVVFADEDEDTFSKVLKVYINLVKPRGRILLIRTVSYLPEKVDFNFARRFLVNAPAHNGIIAEVDCNHNIKRVLRASMQGNYKVVQGSEEEIYQDLARWVRMHYEPYMVTKRHEQILPVCLWDEWKSSKVHREMSAAARELLQKEIIEDQVDLSLYTQSRRAEFLMRAINRSALGESMRAAWLSELGILAVTRSGGKKGNISEDPQNGDLIPVSAVTEDGYVIQKFWDRDFEFADPSVETHEIARLVQAMCLIKERIVRNFEECEIYFKTYTDLMCNMPIIPPQTCLPDIYFDHVHWYLDTKNPKEFDNANIVVSVPRLFDPPIDAACGSRYGALMSLSALFTPDFMHAIRSSSDFKDIILVIHLPGHGSIWIHGDRERLTNAMTSLRLSEPERV